MARSSWTGAIVFAGFPIPVKAYNLVSSPSRESFKTLCRCHGQPIKQQNTCAVDGTAVTDTDKGVEIAKGVFKALPLPALEAIQAAGKSAALEPERICPLDTLDLHMSTGAYALIADATAEKPVAILWRTLAKTDRALVTRWTMRAGSRDSIVAVHAGPTGLLANTLPFAAQRASVPASTAPSIAVSDPELAMFEQALGALYPNEPFDPAAFTSEYAQRRTKAIEQALAGEAISAPAAPAAAPVPDLMAALQASLSAVQTTKPKEEVPA